VRKAGWVIAAVVVVVIVLVVVQMARSTPAQTVVVHAPSPVHVTGTSALPWPTNGSAAVAIGPTGAVRISGPAQEKPIASLAKMMAAYVVLTDHPLQNGQPGPSITITTADVATYNTDAAASDSVLPVSAGETITEQQALEGLLVASADNVAVVLADWDAGSVTAFVAKMNAAAKTLGMDHTHYTDPSGLQTTTVSTPSDQLAIARKAMDDPTFASIVAMQSATFPVGGTVQNYDYDVGHDGIIGIKTGSDSAAGGCWAFAATRTVAGKPQTVYGVVLGIPGTATGLIEPALAAGKALADALPATVSTTTVLPAHTVVGYVTAPWRSSPVPITTLRPLQGLVVNGSTVTFHVSLDQVAGTTVASGQPLGSVTAQGVGGVAISPVEATAAGSGPTLSWRLTRI
jgi:D-alanyl-D-alanine carboxypeptidase (penicillin-binding protein 5/6)